MVDNDDIENDGQQADEQGERPLSERDRMMEEIAAKRAADLLNESGAEPETEAATESEPSDDDAEQRAIQAEQDAKAAKLFAGDADQTLVKLKINGEEQEVPLSRLIADAQKHEAADQRLAEASRLLREARQAPPPQVTQAPAVDADAAKTFIDALFGSNEEEATEALLKLVNRPSQATASIDPEAIAAQVKASIDRDSALQRFASDHPYVMQDPDLIALGDAKLSRRINAGETFAQALQAVGDEMKRFAPAQAVNSDPPATTSRQQILEQKKSRDHVRGQSHSAATSEPPALTPSQVIAEMQAQRQRGNWKPH